MKSTPKINFSQWWYELDQRAKIALLVLFGLLLVALCVVVVLAVMSVVQGGPAQTPTPTPPPTTAPTKAPPTPTPAPTDTPAPTATPTQEPTPTPPVDAQDDIGTYADGEPVEDAPLGIDVRAASPGLDLTLALQPTQGVPDALAGWAGDDEALLWITLHEPIPDPPTAYTEWLYVLDLDGDAETGRPPGAARINPDLGVEVALAVYYDPATDAYATYLLVWDTAQATWANAGVEMRTFVDDSRTVVGLAVSLDALTQAVETTSGVTVALENARGRAAALSGTGEQRVIDFFPDLPAE
jgi:hypothetical protein